MLCFQLCNTCVPLNLTGQYLTIYQHLLKVSLCVYTIECMDCDLCNTCWRFRWLPVCALGCVAGNRTVGLLRPITFPERLCRLYSIAGGRVQSPQRAHVVVVDWAGGTRLFFFWPFFDCKWGGLFHLVSVIHISFCELDKNRAKRSISGSSLNITLSGCHSNAGSFMRCDVGASAQQAISDGCWHIRLLTLAELWVCVLNES